MVIPPARTGTAPIRRTEVIITDHGNIGTRSIIILSVRILATVTTKLIEAAIDEIPARCREKIAMSTAGPAWNPLAERGGYTVHPVATPPSVRLDASKHKRAIGSNQNLMLFIRGNAMSGACSIRGRSQLPKPPRKIGITMKKIIRNAWAVRMTL